MSDSETASIASSLQATVSKPAQTAPVAGRQEAAAGGKVSPAEATAELTSEQVVDAVNNITDHIQHLSRSLQFVVDDQTGDTVVTVSDRETGEVVRQIPSEEVMAMARYLAENDPDPVRGLLMNSKG